MTKKLIWRLGKLPSPDEVRELVKDKIITQDEAREILFSSEEQTTRDKASLESEIKFLRELVDKLSQNRSQIVRIFDSIQPIYVQQPWIKPYICWSNTCSTSQLGNGTSSFSSIKTF